MMIDIDDKKEKVDKKIFVTKSSLPNYYKYCEKIKSIWEDNWLTNNGKLHLQLEEQLKEYLGVDNITLFTNGHLSLEIALEALNLSGEVITTPFTFISTTNAIKRCGLTPVFCDINPIDYTIDVNKIEELITDKTCAIVPVHVYGNVCDVDAIEAIAKKYNLKVIYDAAHAFGVEYNNKSILNYGDMSMLSFHATKVYNTIEGGAVVCKDVSYKDKFEKLKNFGIVGPEEIEYVGLNAKMNEFQAAMGLCNLENLDENISERKVIVERYNQLLSNIVGIKLNQIKDGVKSNYAYYPIQILNDYGLSRDEIFDILVENGIYARKYFYPISNEFDFYKDCIGNTPIAKDVSERILTLPIYPGLELENVERICHILRRKK